MNASVFNKKLYELLLEPTDTTNVCLISGDKLDEFPVQLECKHVFNYKPLYNEIVEQQKKSCYEIDKLSPYQIKCPYCRHIQNGILEYKTGFDKLRGVNWPPSRCYKPYKCDSVIQSGVRKGNTCNKSCVRIKCKLHTRVSLRTSQRTRCVSILKSGKRIGSKCNNICVTKDCIAHQLCKKHNKHIVI
jgi:hypothetical protein